MKTFLARISYECFGVCQFSTAWLHTQNKQSKIIRASHCNSPRDLKTQKSTGTSCEIEIYFSIQTTKYLYLFTLFLNFW